MGSNKSKPLDHAKCQSLAPIWAPFVDAFIDTLHAKGQAVHPPSNYADVVGRRCRLTPG